MIRASCHTADNALALEFDATPWFREANALSILHLAEQGWSSVWVADAVETRPGYEGLHQLIAYVTSRLRDERLKDPTWPTLDCVVNSSQGSGSDRLAVCSPPDQTTMGVETPVPHPPVQSRQQSNPAPRAQ